MFNNTSIATSSVRFSSHTTFTENHSLGMFNDTRPPSTAATSTISRTKKGSTKKAALKNLRIPRSYSSDREALKGTANLLTLPSTQSRTSFATKNDPYTYDNRDYKCWNENDHVMVQRKDYQETTAYKNHEIVAPVIIDGRQQLIICNTKTGKLAVLDPSHRARDLQTLNTKKVEDVSELSTQKAREKRRKEYRFSKKKLEKMTEKHQRSLDKAIKNGSLSQDPRLNPLTFRSKKEALISLNADLQRGHQSAGLFALSKMAHQEDSETLIYFAWDYYDTADQTWKMVITDSHSPYKDAIIIPGKLYARVRADDDLDFYTYIDDTGAVQSLDDVVVHLMPKVNLRFEGLKAHRQKMALGVLRQFTQASCRMLKNILTKTNTIISQEKVITPYYEAIANGNKFTVKDLETGQVIKLDGYLLGSNAGTIIYCAEDSDDPREIGKDYFRTREYASM